MKRYILNTWISLSEFYLYPQEERQETTGRTVTVQCETGSERTI